MKVYLHYDADPEFTKVVVAPAGSPSWTVGDAVDLFVLEYNKRFGHANTLHAEGLEVWNESKRPVDLAARLTKACIDRDDLFLVPSQKGGAGPAKQQPQPSSSEPAQAVPRASGPPSTATTTTSPATAAAAQGLSSLALGDPAAASAPPKEARPASKVPKAQDESSQVLQAALDNADEAMQARNFKAARTIYQQVLSVVPDSPEVLGRLARLHLEAGKSRVALDYARRAAQQAPASSSALQLLGESYMAIGDSEQAIKHMDRAAAACSKEPPARQSEVMLALAKVLHAAYSASQQGDDSDDSDGDDARVKDLHERCVQVVMALVAQDEGNWEYLLMYANLALERGMLEDAIRVALRLLVQNSTHAGIKSLLAQCLMLSGGLDLLLAELGSGGGSAAALAFLANCVKDQGAVAASVQLFEKAVSLEPHSTTYCLNYVHALELDHQFDRLLHEVAGFCGRCKLQLGGKLQSLQPAVAVLEALPPLGHMTSLTWLRAEPWEPQGPAAAAGAPTQGQQAAAGSAAAERPPADAPAKVAYSPEQLDVLALLFTSAKVLYIGGALAASRRLCDLLDSARMASAVELHTTLIRNEAAYFGCVLKLVRDHPPPRQPQEDLLQRPPLFLCGDSHCLSAAWQQVQLRGVPRLIQPLLVTGCKIWHLRPESCFYPKVQFLNTVRKLAPGTQVIMLFGEIDCREGLLLAVEKCKYDSLDEGINHTIDIYVKILLELIKERNLELLVHPVAPVLNETRPTVLAFMKALKTKVCSAALSPAAKGRLHYLDFFGQLLTGVPPKLRPELEFDGTHMAPAYVQHLDQAISSIPQ